MTEFALLPASLPVVMAALLVSALAGAVRGFAGFGYSALTVAGLSLLVAPATLVPAVMSLELLASLSMLRASWQQMHRPWLKALLAGNLLFVPVGIVLLTTLPEQRLRLLVSGALLAAALGLRLHGQRHLRDTTGLRAAAAVSSGLLNGLTASGGVAAALLMAAGGVPPARLRATMVVYLLVAGAYTLLCAALVTVVGSGKPLLGLDTLRWMLLLAPTMLLGLRWGQRGFGKSSPAQYRSAVLNLLILISSLGLLRALW